MTPNIPRIEHHLPQFMVFARELAAAYQQDDLRTWDDVAAPTKAFFTSERLESMETIIPGWERMAGDANGRTLIHIVCVFIALLNSPEYSAASNDEKAILEWSVLLHDIAKETINGQGDSAHAFRSAAEAAIILPPLGFETCSVEHSFFQNWITITRNANFSLNGHVIQDNSRLPEIISGIDAIFGKDQPGSYIVKVVLFHHSLEAEKDWPCAAPLNQDEIQKYLDVQRLRLLRAQMLADSAAWNLFDHTIKERYRAEILESLAQVRQIIESA